MTLEQLQEKKAKLEKSYKEAEAEKQDYLAKANAITQEQLRADGEYRLIVEMIKEMTTVGPEVVETPSEVIETKE